MSFKLLGMMAKLVCVVAIFSLGVQTVAARDGDYNRTKAAWWYSPGYIQVKTSFWETPPDGTPWYSEINFSSNAQTNIISTYLGFSGESHAYWWGYNPWCATKIALTDKWSVAGVAVTVSVPPGIGISTYNDWASFTTDNAVCNDVFNQVQHGYSGIDFNAWDISTFSQSDCANFTITWVGNLRCTSGWDWVNL